MNELQKLQLEASKPTTKRKRPIYNVKGGGTVSGGVYRESGPAYGQSK